MVGYVLVACGGLLGQVVCPAQQLEQRADQVLLGGGLVRTRGGGEAVVAPPDLSAEGVELPSGVRGLAPFRRVADALRQKVFGEKLALQISAFRWPRPNGVPAVPSPSGRGLG